MGLDWKHNFLIIIPVMLAEQRGKRDESVDINYDRTNTF